ncbi:unnamed protein product [Heterobilharzia americana]|nr:unnamed protein product [Heterobilharzia americana]
MKMPNQQQGQQQQTPITINGRNVKEVTSLTYLGSTVSTTGSGGGCIDEDVKSGRIGKARQDFISLKPVWKSSALSTRREEDPDFQHQHQSSQCFCMAQRLGALRKAFPINYRHSSITANTRY